MMATVDINRAKEQLISHTYLISILNYDPDTGIWRWLVDRNNHMKAGDIAGNVNKTGYRIIGINGKQYLSSRLAYFYMTGEWPEKTMDHMNQVKDDDRWENLEQKDDTEQMHNQGMRKDNTSGVKGIHFENRDKVWVGQIRHYRKTYKKNFHTFEEAVAWRKEMETKLLTNAGCLV
jgi:hypothetical protein